MAWCGVVWCDDESNFEGQVESLPVAATRVVLALSGVGDCRKPGTSCVCMYAPLCEVCVCIDTRTHTRSAKYLHVYIHNTRHVEV